MKSKKRRTQNWLIIAVSTLVVVILLRYDFNTTTHLITTNKLDNKPSWVIKNGMIESFDNSGDLKTRLYANTVSFFDTDQTTILVQPKIHVIENALTQWEISANHGLITGDQRIDLHEHVHLRNPSQQQVLETTLLSINLARKLLHTDAAVKISAPQSLATATGMLANWQENTLELLDNVKLTFTP